MSGVFETLVGYFSKLFSKASVDIVLFVGLILVLGEYQYIDVYQVEMLMKLILAAGFIVIIVKMGVTLFCAMANQIKETQWLITHYDGPTTPIPTETPMESPSETLLKTGAAILNMGATKIQEKAIATEVKKTDAEMELIEKQLAAKTSQLELIEE
ncbi:MAG: hypothetical protein GY834_02290 [Bacteroidetes bacterium]|nr:hypothetical protein [Bacteroidota bacterium]